MWCCVILCWRFSKTKIIIYISWNGIFQVLSVLHIGKQLFFKMSLRIRIQTLVIVLKKKSKLIILILFIPLDEWMTVGCIVVGCILYSCSLSRVTYTNGWNGSTSRLIGFSRGLNHFTVQKTVSSEHSAKNYWRLNLEVLKFQRQFSEKSVNNWLWWIFDSEL